MNAVTLVVLGLLVVLVVAMGWQHDRYLSIRRGPMQDQQPIVYAGDTFHVLSYLALAEGADPVESLRKLRNELEAADGAQMVYAGLTGAVRLESSQLGEADWDAIVLMQYPSRAVFDAIAATSSYEAAFRDFPRTYAHGFERPAALNLAIPQLLLGLRAYQLATFGDSFYPLVPADLGSGDTQDPRLADLEARWAAMEPLKRYSEDALVVVNLLKDGTREQRAADRGYGLAMARGFAEGVYGPMHIGRAVSLDDQGDFDRVAIVYYPGIDYMRELMMSTFFTEAVTGKQPGDTLAMPTVPVLSRL